MQISYSCKIKFDSDNDRQKVINLLEAERTVFNAASAFAFKTKAKHISVLHNEAYQEIRSKFPEIPSQVVIKGEQSCLSAYRSAYSNKHKIDKPFVKKRLSLRLDDRLFSVCNKEGLRIRITTLTSNKRVYITPILYPKIQELLDKYKFGGPLLFESDGDIWISFTFEVNPELPINNKACGIDLGIRRLATTSEGNIFVDKKFNKEQRRLRYLKRCLQSKNTPSAKRHLKSVKHNEANKSRNLVHNLTKRIISSTKSDTLVIEDLSKIKDKTKRGISKYQKLKRLASVPFYMIREILTYKAHLAGKQVKTVSPFMTSQIDHKLGRKSGERKGCRFYTTRKGLVYDADINAAINIALRSKQPISCCKALDGQATVNTPIVV